MLGYDMSTKRLAVCAAFLHLVQPLDAETFWLQLKEKGMEVSRAQVYNTLKLLVNHGFAKKLKEDDSRQHVYQPQPTRAS